MTGEAAPPAERERIEQVVREADEVQDVVELLMMVLGPSSLLVAARVDLKAELSAEQIERACNQIADALREAVPDVREVFLDPTARVIESRSPRPAPVESI